MIKTKEDLKYYIEADMAAAKKKGRIRWYEFILKFIVHMRKAEYYKNCGRSIFATVKFKYHFTFYYLLGCFLGFSIPLNSCDEGLYIPHRGTIVISTFSHIGKNCTINIGVNIGKNPYDEKKAPILGDNVYIAPGAKIFGDIVIGNNIAIGANAVVNKSFTEDNVVIAGVPAEIKSKKNWE